ncbi:MAG: precorrin-6A synthase (deacetylating) [Rhodobacteraceae bacterium]|nr:precorrin-6A synthase (deacetylating) [Paracoccaceae bacterium]
MNKLYLIGIGTGNPDHLTGEGARAIRDADLILIPRKGKGKGDLADLRLEIIAQVAGAAPPEILFFDIPKRRDEDGYLQGVDVWHAAIAQIWQKTIATVPHAQKVALLIWGDPSLYDSSLRIAARLTPRPEIKVIPGITALQALTAAHGIALNDIGAPVLVTTGRRLRDEGWPNGIDTIAVMLDGQCSFQSLDMREVDIWWGAYLGMKAQLLVSGPLNDVAARIIATRAQARNDHGWIMDIYLLKKHGGTGQQV